MTAPRTISGAIRRPARRTLRRSPRLLAASRRFGAPRPRTPRTVAPIETSGAGGPPSSPDPSDLAAFASREGEHCHRSTAIDQRGDRRARGDGLVVGMRVNKQHSLGHLTTPQFLAG